MLLPRLTLPPPAPSAWSQGKTTDRAPITGDPTLLLTGVGPEAAKAKVDLQIVKKQSVMIIQGNCILLSVTHWLQVPTLLLFPFYQSENGNIFGIKNSLSVFVCVRHDWVTT